MHLISLQQQAVEQILNLYKPDGKVVCEFKAPTGSGKTLMASAFISNLIQRFTCEKFIFVIATPSSSSLPYFFEQKLNKYKTYLPYSKFDVEYIQSPSATKNDKTESIRKIIPEQNKVYIFGKASFGKGRILQEYGIIADFIQYASDLHYKIIYIRDEAHWGDEKADNSTGAQSFETLMKSNAAFVLKMTATPNDRDSKKVELKEKDLNDEAKNEGEFLLKTTAEPILSQDTDIDNVLGAAINKFLSIKKDYETLGVGIHPAMLIQVANSSNVDLEYRASFEENLDKIKKELDKAHLSWVQYFGEGDKDSDRVHTNNFTLDEITRNNNDIDVILFKIGPSTGWDIPRACMLLQLRQVSSRNLNIQTIGRIKRNPYPCLKKNTITDKYYIISNTESVEKDFVSFYFKLREDVSSETFLKIELASESKKSANKYNKESFQKALLRYLEEKKNVIKQQIISSFPAGKEYTRVVLVSSNGMNVTESITNPFDFLCYYYRCQQASRSLLQHMGKVVDDFAQKEDLQVAFVFTVLLEKHKDELKHLLNKSMSITPCYSIKEEKYNPKEYSQVFGSDTKTVMVPGKYMLEISADNYLKNSEQPLDSDPEIVVFKQLCKKTNEGIINIWAKNYTNSNVYGEYIDDYHNIHKSYFDFIVKFQNNFYLYLEVKGKEDINPHKTALLEQAYNDYFIRNQGNLFSGQLIIAVCKVDTTNDSITLSTFYDHNKIEIDLETLPLSNLVSTIDKF